MAQALSSRAGNGHLVKCPKRSWIAQLRVDRLSDAWGIQDQHRLSFWDALPVASALVAGCTIFLSEDMNGGQKIETLTIVNPFTTAPEAVLGA